jgi:peptide/nickel transport system substrate-binding protein
MSDLHDKLELAKKLAARGRVSRRDFIRLAMAAGITAAAADKLFVTAARAEPKKGGTFRLAVGHGATTDSLDPGLYPDQMTGTMGWGSMGNSLTEVNQKGEITPDLAESYEPADGAKKWIFRLRKGVTFHDGKNVTANDVVASIKHHLGEGSKSAAKSALAAMEDVKADGDAVVFTLKGGNADFPYIVSDYHLPIMPAKDDGSVDWSSGIRTGPYMLENFQAGVSASMKRNPNYYRDTWFDAVNMLVVADVVARTNALNAGEIDMMDRCDLKTLDLLKQNPDVEIDEVTGFGHYYFVMNTTVAPFDNPDVRNALKYAINREDIVEKVLYGHGKPGNDNPVAPGIKFSIDPEPKHSYNPDKAKELLKKAGLETLKVDLSVSDAAFVGSVDAALLYKDAAAKAGIDINVVKEPADSYWDQVWLKKPFVATYTNGRPTVDWMLTTFYAADAAWNDTFWKPARFNELLVGARSETDDAKRAAMYAEAQQLLHHDGGPLIIMFNSYVNAHSKKLAHGDIANNWDLDGMKVTSRWWFA